MDQAMGLVPIYKGGERDATRAARIRRDQLTAQHMARLTALDFSARAASRLIAEAIDSSTHPPVSAARIAREWPRMKRDDGTLPAYAAAARNMTPAERKEYLRQFGGPALPKPKRKRGE